MTTSRAFLPRPERIPHAQTGRGGEAGETESARGHPRRSAANATSCISLYGHAACLFCKVDLAQHQHSGFRLSVAILAQAIYSDAERGLDDALLHEGNDVGPGLGPRQRTAEGG